MIGRWGVACGVGVAGAAALLFWMLADGEEASPGAQVAAQASKPVAEKRAVQWPPPSPYAADQVKRVPLLESGPEANAAQSLAAYGMQGDPRVPPLVRSEHKTELPSAQELADPKAYAQYEVRQNLQVYASFIAASRQELPRLRAGIERGKREGIAPEKIAKIEEKVRRMEAMQAQLLREHPELQR